MTTDMDSITLAQALGFVSFALGISTFYQKNDRKLKIMMLLFNLNHLVHFLLLGSIVSALSALLSALRTATAIYISSKAVAAFYITLGLVLGVCFSETYWDLWSIAGMAVGTYSVFMLKGIPMRIGFLIGATCWLINNIHVGSLGGMLLEATVITMNIMTILRLVREQNQTAATH